MQQLSFSLGVFESVMTSTLENAMAKVDQLAKSISNIVSGDNKIQIRNEKGQVLATKIVIFNGREIMDLGWVRG